MIATASISRSSCIRSTLSTPCQFAYPLKGNVCGFRLHAYQHQPKPSEGALHLRHVGRFLVRLLLRPIKDEADLRIPALTESETQRQIGDAEQERLKP
jgi:hypothetical protein